MIRVRGSQCDREPWGAHALRARRRTRPCRSGPHRRSPPERRAGAAHPRRLTSSSWSPASVIAVTSAAIHPAPWATAFRVAEHDPGVRRARRSTPPAARRSSAAGAPRSRPDCGAATSGCRRPPGMRFRGGSERCGAGSLFDRELERAVPGSRGSSPKRYAIHRDFVPCSSLSWKPVAPPPVVARTGAQAEEPVAVRIRPRQPP